LGGEEKGRRGKKKKKKELNDDELKKGNLDKSFEIIWDNLKGIGNQTNNARNYLIK